MRAKFPIIRSLDLVPSIDGGYDVWMTASPKKWVGHKVVPLKTSIRQLIKDAGLPGGKGNSGPFRFRPEYGIDGTSPLRKGANGGYMDRFGNEWVKGPYHGDKSLGYKYEWDGYLSKSGENHWNLYKSASKRQGGGKYLNVRPDGQLSH